MISAKNEKVKENLEMIAKRFDEFPGGANMSAICREAVDVIHQLERMVELSEKCVEREISNAPYVKNRRTCPAYEFSPGKNPYEKVAEKEEQALTPVSVIASM